MTDYSAIHYLQKKIRKAAAALPQDFKDIPELERYRENTRRALMRMLPVIQPASLGPDIVTATMPLGEDLSISAVDVCVDEDLYTSIHIYRPMYVVGRLPCVLILPGYGQMKNYTDVADAGIAFAKAGFMAAAIDYPATGESASRPDAVTDINNVTTLAYMLGMSDVGLRVSYNFAALRYLKSRGDVDPGRIGMTGLCQGGIILWHTAALTDGFAALAPVCGVTTLEAEACEYVNRQGGWSGASPFVYDILSVADVGQMYAMCAPIPLFVQNNITDIHWPYSGLQKVKDIAGKAYALYGAGDKISFRIEHNTHAFTGFCDNLVSFFQKTL